ncbi:MAG TPA: hypothetical protein PKY96_10950 [Flavobacteriales bacterium]|nr:hypothetical protein [Flavobacteriales bacterium]
MNARINLACALLLFMGTAAAQRVDNAEYFWDTDPGAGNATPMSALDGAYNDAVEAIFLETSTLPSLGAHTLGIRVKDQQNIWGPTFTTVVLIEPPVVTAPDIAVTQAEFFWDTDPGEGNGTPMIAFDGSFNDALEAISLETNAMPSEGVHVLHVRAKDVNSAWSAPFRVVVEVLGGVVTFPDIRVTAAEYFVNDDPGTGLGTPMLAVDNDFSAAYEAIKGGGIPAPVTAGVNVLWVRARDVNNAWGPSFGIVVNIDTTITGTVGMIEEEPIGMRLAPNPASADAGFSITFDQLVPEAAIRVLDGAGRIVSERRALKERRVEVDLRGAAPGVYHVGVLIGELPRWERLVVQ